MPDILSETCGKRQNRIGKCYFFHFFTENMSMNKAHVGSYEIWYYISFCSLSQVWTQKQQLMTIHSYILNFWPHKWKKTKFEKNIFFNFFPQKFKIDFFEFFFLCNFKSKSTVNPYQKKCGKFWIFLKSEKYVSPLKLIFYRLISFLTPKFILVL